MRKKESRKIILSIGDEGAIVTAVSGNKMLKRTFVTSPSAQEFINMMNSLKDAPIYILVDVVDQAYIKQTLPPVSSFNAQKLVQRKLSKDFNESDLKHAINLGRDKTGRKEWNYLFVSVKYAPPLSNWIEAISDFENDFKGVYLLPIESMNLIKDLRKIVVHQKDKKDVQWTVLVSHNRIGGFRQVVYKDDVITFTRIAQPVGMQTPDVVAGNIEQETLNTIEYIRRLGYNDTGIDIYIITSSDVKAVLEVNALPSNATYILTPYEISSKLKLENAAEPKDRFGDVVNAAHFATQKKHLVKFFTGYTAKINKLKAVSIASRIIGSISVIALLGLIAQSFLSSSQINSDIEKAQQNKRINQIKLQKIETLRNSFTGDKNRIIELTKLTQDLSKYSNDLTKFVEEYSTINNFDMYVKDIRMSLNDSPKLKGTKYLRAALEIKFFSASGNTIEQLLEELDIFTGEVKRKFGDYQVNFKDLPKSENLEILGHNDHEDTEEISASIRLTIEGPTSSMNIEPEKHNKSRRRR